MPRRETVASMLMFFIAILFVVSPAMSQPPEGIAILRQMKEVFEPSRPSLRKVVVSSDFKGYRNQFVVGEARKTFPVGKRRVLVLLEPESVRGNTYLFWEREKQPNFMYVYFPVIRRVREMMPVQLYGNFLGTDFTYADLGFVRLHEHYRLLGEEEHGGIRAYKVEEKFTGEALYYSRIIIWVAADSFLPLRRDYYDAAGRLSKTELFKEVITFNNVPTPLLIRMRDRDGAITDFKVTKVEYDVKIPDDLFDPNLLPKVINSPLW
jgi:outer membrane lipoprotein-sorting protein